MGHKKTAFGAGNRFVVGCYEHLAISNTSATRAAQQSRPVLIGRIKVRTQPVSRYAGRLLDRQHSLSRHLAGAQPGVNAGVLDSQHLGQPVSTDLGYKFLQRSAFHTAYRSIFRPKDQFDTSVAKGYYTPNHSPSYGERRSPRASGEGRASLAGDAGANKNQQEKTE